MLFGTAKHYKDAWHNTWLHKARDDTGAGNGVLWIIDPQTGCWATCRLSTCDCLDTNCERLRLRYIHFDFFHWHGEIGDNGQPDNRATIKDGTSTLGCILTLNLVRAILAARSATGFQLASSSDRGDMRTSIIMQISQNRGAVPTRTDRSINRTQRGPFLIDSTSLCAPRGFSKIRLTMRADPGCGPA